MARIKKCIICGEEFSTEHENRFLCPKKECKLARKNELRKLREAKVKGKKPRKRRKRKCKTCFEWFEPTNSRNFNCTKCTGAKDHPEKPCKVCGTMFKPKDVRHLTCGPECGRKIKYKYEVSLVQNEELRKENFNRKRNIIYRGYKDPLIPLPPGRFGYEGIILEDADTEEIQCCVCGLWCKHLASHILYHHMDEFKNVPDRDGKIKKPTIAYKDEFGLMHKTALCSQTIRNKIIASWKDKPYWERERRAEHMRELNREQNNGKRINNIACAEKKNEEGLCFLQVLDIIKKKAIKLGRTPALAEIKGSKGQNLSHTIRATYGGYREALKLVRLKANKGGFGAKRYAPLTSEFLLATLIDFEKAHGREPSRSDTYNNMLPDLKHYENEFKDFNNALAVAFNKSKTH